MATHKFTPVLGKRMRVTDLTQSGQIDPEGTHVATDGFITFNLSSEVEDGVEITQRKASGGLCVNERFASSFKRFNVEVEFCGVNPDVLTKMTNAEPYFDGDGNTIGFTVPEGDIDKHFALELWTGLSGYVAEEGVSEASGYMLLPFVTAGVVGDVTVDGENAVTFTMTGASTKGGNGWGVGPYEVVYDADGSPAALPEALDAYDHLLLIDTGFAPPVESEEPVLNSAAPVGPTP